MTEALLASRGKQAGLDVREMPPCPKLLLRGRPSNPSFLAAAEEAIGSSIPQTPGTTSGSDPNVLWLSPTGWLLLGSQQRLDAVAGPLRDRLGGRDGDVIDVSDEYTHLRVEGPASADLLATCCPCDLSLAALPSGSVARTLVADVAAIVVRRGAAVLELFVDRSYAHHLLDVLHAHVPEFA